MTTSSRCSVTNGECLRSRRSDRYDWGLCQDLMFRSIKTRSMWTTISFPPPVLYKISVSLTEVPICFVLGKGYITFTVAKLIKILFSCLGVTGQSIAWIEGEWSGIWTANGFAPAPPLAPTKISASTSLVTWWQLTTPVCFQGEVWLLKERQLQENTTLTRQNGEIVEFKKASHRQINVICVALRIIYRRRTQHICIEGRVSD